MAAEETRVQDATDEESGGGAQDARSTESGADAVDDELDFEGALEAEQEVPGAFKAKAGEEDTSGTEEQAAVEEKPIDPGLAAQARTLGMNEGLLKNLSDAGLLQETLAQMDAQLARPGQGQRESGSGEQGEGTATQETPAVPQFKVELDPEYHDQEIVDTFSRMNDHYAAELGRLRDLVEDMVAERDVGEFDSMLGSLDDTWDEVFGDGESGSIREGTLPAENRSELYDTMVALQQRFAELGKPLTRQQAFDRARNALFPERLRSSERDKLAAEVESQKGQRAARPTRRQARDTRSPETKARDSVAAKMEQFGVSGSEDDEELLKEIPE